MNSELAYMKHPGRRRLAWMAFYVLLGVAVIFGIYIFANNVRARTLPVGQIEIHSVQSKYLLGEPVNVKVTNNLSTQIYVGNECPKEPLSIYRQEDDRWVRMHGTADLKICKSQNRIIELAANSSSIVNFGLWQKMFSKAGKYRVVAIVDNYNSLPYEDFEIVEPPKPQPQKRPDAQTQKVPPEAAPKFQNSEKKQREDDD